MTKLVIIEVENETDFIKPLLRWAELFRIDAEVFAYKESLFLPNYDL